MSVTISVMLSQEESPSTEETREAQMMGRLRCLLLGWTSMESLLKENTRQKGIAVRDSQSDCSV